MVILDMLDIQVELLMRQLQSCSEWRTGYKNLVCRWHLKHVMGPHVEKKGK